MRENLFFMLAVPLFFWLTEWSIHRALGRAAAWRERPRLGWPVCVLSQVLLTYLCPLTGINDLYVSSYRYWWPICVLWQVLLTYLCPLTGIGDLFVSSYRFGDILVFVSSDRYCWPICKLWQVFLTYLCPLTGFADLFVSSDRYC